MGVLTKTNHLQNFQAGFTLIELMVAMVISLIVITGIYQAFVSQNKAYIVQERIVEMQQTLRAVVIMIEKDIMLAGFDPRETGTFGITTAASKTFAFTYDDEKGAATTINYRLYDSTSDSDNQSNELQRVPSGSATAFHIDELRFAYAYDADSDGETDLQGGQIIWGVPKGGKWFNLDNNNDGVIDTNDTEGGVDTGTAVNVSDIRAVKIWVLARASQIDRDYIDTNTYSIGEIHYVPRDNYRRRLAHATIKMRNMGI